MSKFKCPVCGHELDGARNPFPTVDMIIYDKKRGIVLVKRRFPPLGWALPGGFVEYGESVETAAVREAKEETGLDVELKGLVGVYSDPLRDKRKHTISTVFWGECKNTCSLSGGDDAEEALFFSPAELPQPLAFDHADIINDFLASRSAFKRRKL
jgi:8-oxo-dGTP diphosphatase